MVLPQQNLNASFLAERPQKSGLVDIERLNKRVNVVLLQGPVEVALGLLSYLSPQGLWGQAGPLHTIRGCKRRLLGALLALVPAPLLVHLVRHHCGGGRARREQAVHEVGHTAGKGQHVHALEVVCEEMLGRADDNFSDSNNMDILQLGNLGKHLSDLAKVAHVDPPVVNSVRQGLTVHGCSAMVEAVPDESWDLDSDQEVCSILDQLAFLLELTLVFWMDHARGKHIWVEPDVKFSLLEASNSLCCLLNNLLGAVLHLLLLAASDPLSHALHNSLCLILLHLALFLLLPVLLFLLLQSLLHRWLQLLLQPQLLQLNRCVLDEHHVARLDKGVNQLLSEAGELVLVLDGEAEGLRLLRQLHPLHFQKVHVRWEGAEQVKDVIAAVVANDPLALDRAAQLHLLSLVVDHLVRQNLQLVSSLLQQVKVLALSDNSLAKVNAAVHNRLLLLPLKDSWDDGLGSHPVAAVVKHHCPKGKQALQVDCVVDLHPLKVIPRGDISSSVTTQILVMVFHVKAK